MVEASGTLGWAGGLGGKRLMNTRRWKRFWVAAVIAVVSLLPAAVVPSAWAGRADGKATPDSKAKAGAEGEARASAFLDITDLAGVRHRHY